MTSIPTRQIPEYRTWQQIKQRCYNDNNVRFGQYGGRGIVMCAEWRDSFPRFCEDIGAKPTPKHSIDRIDVNGPYSPDNCRWATDAEQRRNRTDTILITYQGETMCLYDWANRLGIPYTTLRGRLARGMPTDQMLTANIGSLDSSHPKLTEEDVKDIRRRYSPGDAVNGQRALAREYGVHVNTIYYAIVGRNFSWVE